MEQNFYPVWRRYRRLLKQRNTALQTQASRAVCLAWDAELASVGEQLHQWRRTYVGQLRPQFLALSQALFGADLLEIDLKPGWSQDRSLYDALAASVPSDQQQRYTHVGPHRDDLELRWQGEPVRIQCSHGQQRLLFIALKLAQLVFLAQAAHKTGVLLIDDLYSELDAAHTERLLALLLQFQVQSFITTTQHGPLQGLAWGRLFHVERGRLV